MSGKFRLGLVLFTLLSMSLAVASLGAEESDALSQALAQGDLYQSKRKYDLALDSYHKADKLSHHTSAACYLKIASVERKLGDFSSALDNTKKAAKAAGEQKGLAVQAHQLRASLLAQMAGKSTDKKLKEAEEELKQALALDANSGLTHFNLGIVLLREERDIEGLAELNRYVSEAGGDSRMVAEARRVIANPVRARAPFAPDFSFVTQENQSVSNASLRGKVVLLDFWGTWCPPCRESVPVLRSLNKRYAGKPFQLVGISSDDDEDVWRTFIAAQHMDWWEYIDLEGRVLEDFKIESFPTYVVLDKDGVVRFRQSGFSELVEGELEDAINKALKRESDPKLAAALGDTSMPEKESVSGSTLIPASSRAATSDTTKRNEKKDTARVGSKSEAGANDEITGNVYKNAELGMSFVLPQGWSVAKPEVLRALDERMAAAAKATILQQHPGLALADSVRFSTPKTVLYASRRGADWDGQHVEIPCIRIAATASVRDALVPDAFEHMADAMAAANQLKRTGPTVKVEINKHQFLRADFERKEGAVSVYQ